MKKAYLREGLINTPITILLNNIVFDKTLLIHIQNNTNKSLEVSNKQHPLHKVSL